jgi:hypothetical protein
MGRNTTLYSGQSIVRAPSEFSAPRHCIYAPEPEAREDRVPGSGVTAARPS